MKYHFECTTCGKQYKEQKFMYLCPSCEKLNSPEKPPAGVLKTVYDYENTTQNFDELEKQQFLPLLPINSTKSLPNLRVGNTPLYKHTEFNSENLNFELFLKDDSQNPTFSFKDRASALVSAYAKENQIDTIVAASTGNAGSSLAGMCAVQKQKAIVYVPESAPIAKLTQIKMYGAELKTVQGNYDKAFDLSIEATKKYGHFNRNTAFNPFTIEGKKTVAFELFSQLNKNIPDTIFVPVGDGVIISSVFKGFEDLFKLKIIEKMPNIVAVQSEGSKNIVQNLEKDEFTLTPSNTLADSISVDVPRNFEMTKKFIQKYNADYTTVTDDKILEASRQLSKNTGIFSEPAAATAFAGFLKFWKENKISENSKVVVLLTGSGLKDLKSVNQ